MSSIDGARPHPFALLLAANAFFAALLFAGPGARAQTGCAETTRFDPPLRVLRCADGLVIETERDATLRPVDDDRDGRPEAAELGGRAAYVTVPRRRAPRGGFQILTPHAIASVRGTAYAVDVTGGRTSVLVAEGRVAVARRAAPGAAVTLGPGEGVDVDAGGGPLEVRRWPRERAAALLARFGR